MVKGSRRVISAMKSRPGVTQGWKTLSLLAIYEKLRMSFMLSYATNGHTFRLAKELEL